jgi:hypothetical protein
MSKLLIPFQGIKNDRSNVYRNSVLMLDTDFLSLWFYFENEYKMLTKAYCNNIVCGPPYACNSCSSGEP